MEVEETDAVWRVQGYKTKVSLIIEKDTTISTIYIYFLYMYAHLNCKITNRYIFMNWWLIDSYRISGKIKPV